MGCSRHGPGPTSCSGFSMLPIGSSSRSCEKANYTCGPYNLLFWGVGPSDEGAEDEMKVLRESGVAIFNNFVDLQSIHDLPARIRPHRLAAAYGHSGAERMAWGT